MLVVRINPSSCSNCIVYHWLTFDQIPLWEFEQDYQIAEINLSPDFKYYVCQVKKVLVFATLKTRPATLWATSLPPPLSNHCPPPPNHLPLSPQPPNKHIHTRCVSTTMVVVMGQFVLSKAAPSSLRTFLVYFNLTLSSLSQVSVG